MKKRILIVLLCLCMVAVLLPATALATGSATSITDGTGLKNAFATGGTYILEQDITYNSGYTLSLDDSKELTIIGNGKTITTSMEFSIGNGATLKLSNLTIDGGARCIKNEGMLTMEKVTLTGANMDWDGNGAGLYNAAGATAILTNCNIRGNACPGNSWGGGSGGGFYNAGTLIMENCAIVENTSTKNGAGGINYGTLYMNNCTVANNESGSAGGGIYNKGGTAYLMNSTVTGNITTYTGGGIYNSGDSLYAVNSVFAFNYANSSIKDIYCPSGPNLYSCAYGQVITNDTITGCQVLSTANSEASVTDLFNAADSESSTYARPAVTSFAKDGFTSYGVYLKSESALLTGGTATYYDRTDSTVKMSYGAGNTALGTLGTTDNQVTTYQDGSERAAGVFGALPKYSTYTVTVKSSDNAYGTASADLTSAASGTVITLTATPNANYKFQQWMTSTPGVVIDGNNQFTMPASDVTVTAVFMPKTYTVSFNPNGGTINSGNFSDYTYSIGKTLPTDVTKTGNTFDGWYTDSGFTGEKVTAISATDSGTKEYWAKWTPKTYTVSFNLNGATGTTPASISVTYDEHYGDLPTPPERPGYTFDGWYNSSSGGSKVESTTQFNYPDNQTLYARWMPLAATAPVVTTGGNLALTYGYTADSISVTAAPIEGHTFTYQWYSNDTNSNTSGSPITGETGSSYAIPAGKSAGTTEYYYCVVTATRTDNGQTATAASAVITVTVGKANGSLTPPTAITGLVYNGSAQELINAGSGTGGTIQYSLDGANWNTAVPTATNAGTYTVYYKLVGDTNHNDVAGESFNVTIGKATPSYSLPTGLTAKYSQTLADVDLSGHTGWSWMDSTQSVGDPSATPRTFQARFTPTDTNNYQIVENIAVSVKVNQADSPTLPDIPVSQKYTVTTGEKDIGAAGMPADAGTLTYIKGTESTTGSVTISSWNVDSTGKVTYTLTGGGAGDTVTLPVVIDSDNYKGATVQVIITLTPKATQDTLTVTGDTTVTFGQTLTLSSSGGSGTGAVTYEVVSGGTGAATIEGNVLTPTTAGTVQVKAVKAADNDYNQAESAPVTITITPKQITAPAADTTVFTYNGSAQTYTLAANDAYTVSGNVQTNANESGHTVTVALSDKVNTVWAGTQDTADKEYPFVIRKANPTGTPAYTAITASGKTLADAALTTNAGWPAGTLAWVDADGTTPLASTTEVVANTSYKWLFTPTDTTNYNTLTGSITPYVVSNPGIYIPPTYKVESEVTEDTDGRVSFSTGSAKKGDTVTITVTPDHYYKVDGVVVKDRNGNEIAVTANEDGTFTFQMPASQVTVEPVFSWDSPFTDVDENAYYAPAVEWGLKNSIINDPGDDTTFSPNAGCTRAQIVTFLWQAAGCPEPAGMSSFTDVSADAYYAKAVAWAVEQGITKGTGGGKFSPDEICTRSQGVTFLYRATGSPEVSDDIAFSDVAAGSYYVDAVAWAAQNGVTNGTGNGKFSPGADCTRAQIVTFLYRWMVK